MYLFTIEKVFMIEGRGLILIGGIENLPVTVEAEIKLIKPNKSVIDTKITGIGFSTPQTIFIESYLIKEDIPIGTEVWLK